MATWTVAESADEKFDIETFFALNGQVLHQGAGAIDIVYYRESEDQPTYYVIHATKPDGQENPWISMDFQTHVDSGNQTHATLTDIAVDYSDFNTLTATHTGADVASFLFQGDDTLTGSSHDDILRGYAGKDSIDGKAGADELYGGDGNDSYVVDDTGDLVTELKDQGTDTVKASVDFSLGAFVENLTLSGSSDTSGTGNALANILIGNGGDNILQGLGKADVIAGGNGADSIYGGMGKDVLTGGKGADSFFFKLGETAEGKSGADTIADFRAAQGDLINLHSIDANEGKNGNQAFHFIGSSSFSHHAGELRFEKTDADTYVSGDTDGDGKSDFTIHLDAAMNLNANAFAL